MSDKVYPVELSGRGRLVVVPERRTVIKEYEGAQEQRDMRWLTPRYRFEIEYPLVEIQGLLWAKLWNFFQEHGGRHESFLFQDWTTLRDYGTLGARLGEILGKGNGSRVFFKTHEDVLAGAVIYKDGVLQTQGILQSDNFNRADNNSLGASWTESEDAAALLRVLSNQLRIDQALGGGVALFGGVFPSNQYSKMTLKANSGTAHYVGVVIRGSGTVNSFTGYAAWWAPSQTTDKLRITKYVAQQLHVNTGTSLGAFNGNLVVGDVLTLEGEGTTIRLKQNTTTRVTAVDGAISSGQPGIWGARGAAGTTDWDDWEGGQPGTLVIVDAATGKVTFLTAPALSALITADVSGGYFRTRFDADDLRWERIKGIGYAVRVPLVQVRENL